MRLGLYLAHREVKRVSERETKMFTAKETKTVPMNELKAAGKSVKFNRNSRTEATIAAMRLSIKSGQIGYVVPTAYGYTIMWNQSDIMVFSGYIEVNQNVATIYQKLFGN